MSRKPLSLKSRGVSKRKGVRHKQLSWQTSINSYFGGKSLPTQPTLSHFIQKAKSPVSQSTDLPLSLDKIAINERDVPPNTEPDPATADTLLASQTHDDVENADQLDVGDKCSNDGLLKENFAKIKGNACQDDSSHPSTSRDDGCCSRDGGGFAVDSSRVLQEQSLNCSTSVTDSHVTSSSVEPAEPGESVTNDSKSPSVSLTTMPLPFSMKPPDNIRPPLSEVLIEPSPVGRKPGLNPFAKLDAPSPSLSRLTSHLPSVSETNEQGPPPRKMGLSLKVRKRKFVMSPSKPRQGKPVRQVSNEGKVDENKPLYTPPLFTTPSHPHNLLSSHPPTSTSPSLFSPSDRDLLDQYSSIPTTPCRRLSLADLDRGANCDSDKAGLSGRSPSDYLVAQSCDVSAKSCDQKGSLQPLSDPSNYSFSAFDEILDQLDNTSCDPTSKSGDVTNRSRDLFDQSHDSFDELIQQADVLNNDVAEKSHDPANGVTPSSTNEAMRSHDPADDVTKRSHDLTRHFVVEAVMGEWDGGGGRGRPQLTLKLLHQTTHTETVLLLRDEWVHTPISAGDTVQVNPPPEWNGDEKGSPCVIDSHNRGSVILSPDLLITPTAIATNVTCPRKAILAEIFKGISKDSVAMVTGNLLHQVLQGVLVKWAESRDEKGVSKNDIDGMMRVVLSSPEALNHLYSLSLSDEEALSLLTSLSPSLLDWCGRFLQPSPLPARAEIEFKRSVCDGDGMVCVSVDKVHDIEENIWSPRLGLKGKVDATLQIKMRRGQGRECSHRVPLEIKTGKMHWKQGSLEHRAQLSLYSLMLRERYSEDSVPGGLLYYMKAGHMQGLQAEDHDIRSLLMARNAVASHHGRLAGQMILPEMLRETHVCRHCPYLPHCCLTHKSLEEGTADTSGLGELFETNVHHLSQKHLDFFSRWVRLVMREEWRGRGRGEYFWRFTAHDRERDGVAMANMLAHPPVKVSEPSANRHLQKFSRKPTSRSNSSPPSHPHTLTPNERIVVSKQDGTSWAVAMGMVTMATDEEVEVSLDKPVSCGGVEYRLDVAPSYRGSASLVNLARLCSSDSERDAQLRDLVIDLQPPRFHPSPAKRDSDKEDFTHSLNENQKSALNKVLSSKDYCLILGRPGTGKTTTISELVQTLVARGASVLITSYTHSAVDNILLKLKEVVFSLLSPSTLPSFLSISLLYN